MNQDGTNPAVAVAKVIKDTHDRFEKEQKEVLERAIVELVRNVIYSESIADVERYADGNSTVSELRKTAESVRELAWKYYEDQDKAIDNSFPGEVNDHAMAVARVAKLAVERLMWSPDQATKPLFRNEPEQTFKAAGLAIKPRGVHPREWREAFMQVWGLARVQHQQPTTPPGAFMSGTFASYYPDK